MSRLWPGEAAERTGIALLACSTLVGTPRAMEQYMFYDNNKILTMLEQKKIPLGTQCFTGSAALVEILGATGFDFVMFDAEHSANNARAMEDLVRTAAAAGMASYIRVADPHDATDVTRALESGAEGLVLPEIHSVGDINAAANAAYFPPKGERSICPSTRSANYNFRRFVEFTERNNRTVTLVPEIENPDGVANIEEICAHPDVRMIIFGQGDLAFSRGEGIAMDKGLQTALDFRAVLAAAKKHDVAVVGGPVLVPTAAACRQALEAGVTVFCLGLDSMGFRSWCEDTVRALAEGVDTASEWTRPAVPESGFPTCTALCTQHKASEGDSAVALVKRTVIGPNADKMSAILYQDSPNEQDIPNVARRSTLWATTELPIDNSIKGDRGADVTIREPTKNGMIFRALEIPPDLVDKQEHIKLMKELNDKVKQKYLPTQNDLERHPTMHRTDTLDCFIVARGEVYLVTDTDEVLLREGDTAVVQGVNHAWSNRSSDPALIVGTMTHAKPLPHQEYPAPGL